MIASLGTRSTSAAVLHRLGVTSTIATSFRLPTTSGRQMASQVEKKLRVCVTRMARTENGQARNGRRVLSLLATCSIHAMQADSLTAIHKCQCRKHAIAHSRSSSRNYPCATDGEGGQWETVSDTARYINPLSSHLLLPQRLCVTRLCFGPLVQMEHLQKLLSLLCNSLRLRTSHVKVIQSIASKDLGSIASTVHATRTRAKNCLSLVSLRPQIKLKHFNKILTVQACANRR